MVSSNTLSYHHLLSQHIVNAYWKKVTFSGDENMATLRGFIAYGKGIDA